MNRILIGQLADKQKNLTEQWIKSDNLLFVFLNAAETAERYPNTITGADLARLLNILARAEIKEGGPYRSFLGGGENNIDIATNAAIAYFLSRQKVTLPELDMLIEKAIVNYNFHSIFFASDIPTIYIISKFYNGPQKKILADYVRDYPCLNDADQKLALEAILTLTKPAHIKPDFFTADEGRIMEMIMDMAGSRFAAFPNDFRKAATARIEETIRGNQDKQMPLMPYYTKIALGRRGRAISDQTVARIGLANVFFWTAFIIYDDFWDNDEKARPPLLPVANLLARHYTGFYRNLYRELNGHSGAFDRIMDDLDAANNWETSQCRFKIENGEFRIPELLPDFGDYELKYRPAAGHILGPAALFCQMGLDWNSDELKNLIAYFKNYLIAMQINDDMHDWFEDLRRGHLTTVTAMLLVDWRKKYPGIKKIDLQADLEKLQKLFWFKTIKRASQTVLDYTGKSRHALRSLKIIENFEPLERYTVLNENVAKKALAEQEMSIEFLKEFN